MFQILLIFCNSSVLTLLVSGGFVLVVVNICLFLCDLTLSIVDAYDEVVGTLEDVKLVVVTLEDELDIGGDGSLLVVTFTTDSYI